MNGQFIKKLTPSTILFCCGLAMIGLSIHTIIAEGFSPIPHSIFLGLGGISACFNLFVLISMHTSYFQVDEQRLQARYLCFVTLDCPLSDVAFVLPQLNSLTVILKNGKRHTLAGMANSFAVGRYLRKQIFSLETAPVEELRAQLAKLTAKRKKYFYFVFGVFALMIATILVTVALTGGRDIGEFTPNDRILFAAMGVVELVEVVVLFWVASKAGRLLWPVEHTKFRLRSALIASQPLPPGNARYVYTNPDFFQRVTLFGFPSDSDMYYVIERITKDHILFVCHESALFPDERSLLMELEYEGIDITSHFI